MFHSFRRLSTIKLPHFYAGVDITGRNSVIGPLIIALAVVPESLDDESTSKLLKRNLTPSPTQIHEIYEYFADKVSWKVLKLPANEIDQQKQKAEFQVRLEQKAIIQLLKSVEDDPKFKWDTLLLNSPLEYSKLYSKPIADLYSPREVLAYHNLGKYFLPVQLASIFARHEELLEIEDIEKKTGLKVGSGSLADPVTSRFVEQLKQDVSFATIIRQTLIKNNKAEQTTSQ